MVLGYLRKRPEKHRALPKYGRGEAAALKERIMGHTTVTQSVPADTPIDSQPSTLFARNPSRAMRLADAAIGDWYNSGESFGDSVSSYNASFTPITSDELSQREAHKARSDASIVVPVAAPKDVVAKTKKIQVEVNTDEAASVAQYKFSAIEILERNGIMNAASIESVTAPRPLNPVAKATEGKLVTKYTLAGRGGQHVGVAGRSFSSLAEARAAGVEMMKQHATISRLEVRSFQVRETADGTENGAVATITRPEQTVKLTVTYVEHTVKPGAQPVSYLVGFDVHH